MVMAWAFAWQKELPEDERYYVEAAELDSLKTANHLLNSNVPILFDEVRLTDRTKFQHMSPDQIKSLLCVEQPSTARARETNAVLHALAPRVFTSNAETLEEFVGGRNAADMFAIRKKCWVFRLREPFVPAESPHSRPELPERQEALDAALERMQEVFPKAAPWKA
jgi:hypothetical protein